ncbi:MAG: NAD-dependent epimerase/dehydratase family protein, partial [Proteobacteria bacterium]|nr:NAD-dependent epimerase/dehydratase family protein [Pseudomonadota bacterium]
MEQATFVSEYPVSAAELFAWHERPGAFERLNPPWAPVRIVSQDAGVKDGARVSIKVPLGPVSIPWDLEHRGYIAGQEFSDIQLRGPFSAWKHRHLVEATGPKSSRLTDLIEYAAPLGPLGKIANAVMIAGDLKRVFKYRHEVLKNDLALLARYPSSRPLKVLISGASGLVGTALSAFLGIAGHEVWKLVRREASAEKKEIFWDPARGILDEASLESFDAVINLSGENVAGARWSESFKGRLLSSRTQTTSLLVTRLAKT